MAEGPSTSTSNPLPGVGIEHKKTTKDKDTSKDEIFVAKSEKEGALAEKVSGASNSKAASKSSETGSSGMFGRTLSAPAAPAWLIRRTTSAIAPRAEALNRSLEEGLYGSIGENALAANSIDDASPSKALADSIDNDRPRIAPSRAKGGATQVFSRATSAPTGSPLLAVNSSTDESGIHRPPSLTSEGDDGFGRTGSAARAAAAGLARFRRVSLKVTSVIRLASTGKSRADGDNTGGDKIKDDLHVKSNEGGGASIFGFKRTLSAPSAPIHHGMRDIDFVLSLCS